MNQRTLIIVGAGLVGSSTALAAIDKYDKIYLIDDKIYLIDDKVYLIDDSSPLVPASQGLARIARASYPGNEPYEPLASEALRRIKSGSYSQFFHESKRKVQEPGGTGSKRNTFRDVKFEELDGKYDDQNAGWLEAANSLKHTIQMARDGGVEFISERVTALIWDGNVCSGVRTKADSEYHATKVLVAMGYQTLRFLASEGKPIEDGLCQTLIVPCAEVKLDDQQQEELERHAITIVPGVGKLYLRVVHRVQAQNT
jgi:glycine/D-amino acid oxidase-like deaminating enzyme